MDKDALDFAFEGAVWAAIIGGTILLVAYLATLPALLLLAGWLLFLGSVAAAFVLGVVTARREPIGRVRAVGRGFRAALSWIFWFLP